MFGKFAASNKKGKNALEIIMEVMLFFSEVMFGLAIKGIMEVFMNYESPKSLVVLI